MKLDFRLFMENLQKSTSYWISPRGEIMSVDERHIEAVVRTPEKFGFTKERLADIFSRHKESPNQEGDARNEIITEIMNNGWIRIRKNNRPDRWHIQTSAINHSFYKRLQEWAWQMIDSGLAYANEEIYILPLQGNSSVVSFQDLIRQAA